MTPTSSYKISVVIRFISRRGHLEFLEIILVAIITPFKFPLEIPVLQLMGALYMQNKPLLKVYSEVYIVMQQMLRMIHDCGIPVEDVDFINCDGNTMIKLIMEVISFTRSRIIFLIG